MNQNLQLAFLVIGTLFILLGLAVRSLFVFAMSCSDYDRFSYMATWVLVSPALLIGFLLVWLSITH